MAVGPVHGGRSMRIPKFAVSVRRQARIWAAFSIVIFALSLVNPAYPQSTAGRVLGNVTDQSGAAVAGATVVVTDAQRGTSRTMVTDDSGNYSAPELQPGVYKVHVE